MSFNSGESQFWNYGGFLPENTSPVDYNADSFRFDCSEEEMWLPSDQTIHWGKRPAYTYPTVQILKKHAIPSIPRGCRLVAKITNPRWTWEGGRYLPDEHLQDHPNGRPDPNTLPCFEEDKTLVYFEKGQAIFRHLRISKDFKLKKTETFTITSLEVTIGFYSPFSKSFRSLNIVLTRKTNIRIVAHKGSVRLLRKHGLLPSEEKSSPISEVPLSNTFLTSLDSSFSNLPTNPPDTQGSSTLPDTSSLLPSTFSNLPSSDPTNPLTLPNYSPTQLSSTLQESESLTLAIENHSEFLNSQSNELHNDPSFAPTFLSSLSSAPSTDRKSVV